MIRERIHTLEKGFVLTEAIIAMGAMATIFAAVLALLMSSLAGTRASTDQLVATYLAQDAVEAIYAKHDHNGRNKNSFLYGLTCTPSATCSIDTTVTNIADLDASHVCTGNDCRLYRDVNNRYVTTSGSNTVTPYFRTVTVEELIVDAEALLTVTVSWEGGKSAGSVSVPIRLYKDY